MLMYLTIIDSKEGQQKFEFIYNRYKKLMFYIANKILGDTRDSEDTVHDAFLKIIEIIDDIKDVESPQTRSLIVTITENKAIDLYRKRQRKTVLPFEEEYLGVPNCSDNVFLSAREGVGRQQGFPKYQIHDYEGVRNGKRCEGNQRFYCCRYFYKCL